MAGIPNYRPAIPEQLQGSEYGGVAHPVAGGVQPKDPEALTNGEILRLGYMTGDEAETRARLTLDDRRQMLGLRPAQGSRPRWLEHVNIEEDSRLESEARRQGFS
jgi:hypothetical protein